MMDLVLRLREARRMSGLSQEAAAKQSGVGIKTISSFETGQRTDSIKVKQLEKLLRAYSLTPEEFFSEKFEARAIVEKITEEDLLVSRLVVAVTHLNVERRTRLIRSFLDMTALAEQSERRGTKLHQTAGGLI